MDGVLREALSGQVARGLRAAASARDDPLGADALVLQRRERVLDDVVVDAREQQVVPDERVAGAAIG